jgi:hypothetical protein
MRATAKIALRRDRKNLGKSSKCWEIGGEGKS